MERLTAIITEPAKRERTRYDCVHSRSLRIKCIILLQQLDNGLPLVLMIKIKLVLVSKDRSQKAGFNLEKKKIKNFQTSAVSADME